MLTRPWLAGFAFGALAFALPTAGSCATFSIAGIATGARASSANQVRSYDSDMLLGYGAGALAEFTPLDDIISEFGVETGLLYVQRAIGYGSAATETMNWLEIPILARLHIMDSFSIGAGIYLADGIGGIKSVTGTATTTFSYSDAQLSSIDYGLSGSVSYTFSFSGFVDFRYDDGLRNLAKADGVSYKFSEFLLLLGYRF